MIGRWKRIGAMALALGLAAWAVPAAAGEQARRALEIVSQMRARGEIPAGASIHVVVKQGNIASFVGRERELQREWEQATGIVLDASVMPQQASLEFIRDSTGVDLTIARNHEYPDLMAAGLIEDLAPMLAQLGFQPQADGDKAFILYDMQSASGPGVAAIPADLDAAVLYLRKDLLEAPERKAAYLARFGTVLDVPATWDEYQRQVCFFNDPAAGFYGALEPRERSTGWMYWLPRYLALRAPVMPLFDDDMRPLLESPEGLAATRSYLATVPCSPPGIADEHADYSYTLPLFLGAKGYSTIITIAGAKLAGAPSSKIRDHFVAAPVPGWTSKSGLLRRPIIMYGNNLVIPRSSERKTLALLYAMWLTDEDNSTLSVGVAGGFADPYRRHHLADARIRGVYGEAPLQALADSLPDVSPPGTGLPGDAEYLQALSDNLWRAARGEFGAEAAMARTAASWEQITERYGRADQRERWTAFRRQYPAARPAEVTSALPGPGIR